MKLMRSRVPVSDLLEDPDTDPELAYRLQQANGIREFAWLELGLAENSNYSQFAPTGRQAVTWNVVAAPEFSLEPKSWCFPVAGCVSYRGYFEQSSAEAFAARMKTKSYDVMISPAIAYSTLGWFEDPLLDTMLQYSDAQLAGIMFHELAHEKLYVKSDTAFSEAFAGFVEETGVQLWLQKTDQIQQLEQWQARKQAAMDFNRLLQDTRKQLQDVYVSNKTEEEKLLLKKESFEELKQNYQGLVEHQWNGLDYFALWMTGELNNAHLSLMNSYEGGNCAFSALYAEADRNLETFYLLAEQKAQLNSEQRSAWLNQPCEEYAHVAQ
jgi:predicted aminopeptidase